MAEERQSDRHQLEPHPTPAGQYYLMEKVAQGGMAEIFKGLSYDVSGIKKTVCIKKILPHIAASQEFIDSLIDEAKIVVTLSHGNIAQVYDLGKVGDDYFMVMEFVEGRSLSQINKRCLARSELVPVPYLCYIMAEVLSGLNYIHLRADERGKSLGIVHRDISPQNIMISFSGTVKIIDFGIAKSKMRVGTTDSGILKGKFAYMSPEQARGDPIDHRSDIFSLGVIFHEMLTGQRLFKAEENRETLRNVRRAKVDAPSSIRADLPPELDWLVMRALARDRRERYPFASEMHDELVKFLYTSYPDFKPSAVATFVMDLFKEDMPAAGEEVEAKTPYLIIDHTSSALVDRRQFEETGIARAPIDMEQYMVGGILHRAEEHTPPTTRENMGGLEEAAEHVAAPGPEGEPFHRPHRRTLMFAGIALAAAAVAAIVVISLMHWGSFRQPAPPAPEQPPAVGRIVVTTQPPDAEISIDGELAGSGSPMTLDDLAAGAAHELAVQKEGFIRQTRRFTLSPNESRAFSIALQAVRPPTSTLVITSMPPGAVVFLDDRETKFITPATIGDIEPGTRHTIGLHLPQHRYWTAGVETKPNETQNFHVQLALDYGSISVSSQPEGALVLINGAPAGQTPLTREGLVPGTAYRVEIWQEGYQPAIREILVNAGKTEQIHVSLEKGQPPPVPEPAPPAPAAPAAQPAGGNAPSPDAGVIGPAGP